MPFPMSSSVNASLVVPNPPLSVMQQVAVIIPIYKEQHTPLERMSLHQSCQQLKEYPLIVVHPEGLDVSAFAAEFPRVTFRPFPPHYFAGIEGYNRLMFSAEFYGAFLGQYEYLLICQPDVYIFRGKDLSDWCSRGYDYIGAPWVERPCYRRFPLRQWMRYEQWRCHRRGQLCRQDFWGKVGNGGLSLRRVESFYRVATEQREHIERYLDEGGPFHAEDLYWASEAKGFRYPPQDEALLFSFDKDADYCYFANGGQLPFGCHAWFVGRNARFWLPIMGLRPFYKNASRYPLSAK